jgi:hypothetical protein
MKPFVPKFKKIRCYLGIYTTFGNDLKNKLTINFSIFAHRFKRYE